jgi:site-specific recombinase XerD
MQIENSVSVKSSLNDSLKWQINDYLISLHDVSEGTKHHYASCFGTFVDYLEEKGIKSFEEVTKTDIGQFLSAKNTQNTKNLYIFIIKSFYKNYLGKDKLVEQLHQKPCEETLTPSELLTPEEVIALANEAGKRRDMNKVIILTLFESCARISEVLGLKLGDVLFSSVVNKEDGNRKLIATLHFKRSKGNIKKQPVVLTMFASELKRWVENHPTKNDGLSPLFPSTHNSHKQIDCESVATVIWNAGERLGIKKRTNPHWFRHSGLSYFANNLNYNEQLLMWRAGWTSTQMAARYIHSGAELEGKSYLEKMGYAAEEKKEIKVMSKTCPHCQANNPYTNSNCDLCGMPLSLEEYKIEIEKKRNVESLYQNLNKIYTGKLSDGQMAQLNNYTATIRRLAELGRDELATQYIELLLTGWVKMFLT